MGTLSVTQIQYQGSGTWPYAGLSLLKVKKCSIVIQMVQTLYRSANILHVCSVSMEIIVVSQQ